MTQPATFIFECVQHYYEIGALLGLWQATSDGGKNLLPKTWIGKFPVLTATCVDEFTIRPAQGWRFA